MNQQQQNQKVSDIKILTEKYQELLQKYSYDIAKPFYSSKNYSVWHGHLTQTSLPVTIKLLKNPNADLSKYLKKLKNAKSEFVIKVFELSSDQSTLLFITEKVTYGTLKKALKKCQHLQQNDAIFISRILLNGQIDLLKLGCSWFGTQEDIEFTDTGLKLSWNNSCRFSSLNPFPKILNNLVTRNLAMIGSYLLPFPEIKTINELIKVSGENVSQIASHPQLKQKIKMSKTRGNGWLGMKQLKYKNQYFDETVLLAVSNDYGFLRVKIYERGTIDPQLIALNYSQKTFTRILNVYEEGNQTIIISEYSNDGNLESYIKMLKASGTTLKEQHIQFFFVSLFQPLKTVQQSPLKSINMLHIKNVYIENGIPKIGEPIPLSVDIQKILKERFQVPDFYHPSFKRDPKSHGMNYDTYSLGVLLYKLMYNEYPIFPNGKVHIPTTPAYNKRLKTSLQVFLNEGGALNNLQKRIQISQNVLKKVQENRQILNEGFAAKMQKKFKRQEQKQVFLQQNAQSLVKIELVQQKNEEVQPFPEEQDCYKLFLSQIQLQPAQKLQQTHAFLDILQQSPYKKCRIWSKILVILILYLFMFYYSYLFNNVALISDQGILQTVKVLISSTNYSIVTSNYNNFKNTFTNQTLSNLQGSGLWCAIDSYQGNPVYSKTISSTSSSWLFYLVSGLISLLLILALKIVQIYLLDGVKTLYLRQNGIGKFNLTNFIICSLLWSTVLAGHFFLFNFIYYTQTDPCVGFPNNVQYGSTSKLFSNQSEFLSIYAAVFMCQLCFFVAYFIVIRLNQRLPYNKIINPLTTFGVVLFMFILIVRFGVIMKDSYYPSASNDLASIISGFFTRKELIGILGILPEILLVLELALSILVDWLFWVLIDQHHNLLTSDNSVANDGVNEFA